MFALFELEATNQTVSYPRARSRIRSADSVSGTATRVWVSFDPVK
jgi:hypothetical protein